MSFHLILTFSAILILVLLIFYCIVNSLCLPYIRTHNKLILTLSFSMNFGFVSLLIFDIYQTLSKQHQIGLVQLWRLIYWVNLSFGFLIFPIITEQEKQTQSLSIFRHLYNFWKRRFFIVVLIAVPIIFLILLTNDVSVFSLFRKDIIIGWPVFMLVLWGFLLLNVHLSLAFNVLPSFFFVRIFPSKEISRHYIF